MCACMFMINKLFGFVAAWRKQSTFFTPLLYSSHTAYKATYQWRFYGTRTFSNVSKTVTIFSSGNTFYALALSSLLVSYTDYLSWIVIVIISLFYFSCACRNNSTSWLVYFIVWCVLSLRIGNCVPGDYGNLRYVSG